MKTVTLSVILGALTVVAQTPPPQPAPPPTPQAAPQPGQPVPIFHVQVIERTTKAVNYRYRSGPTWIDFRGTVLMPTAKGWAQVQSHPGRVEVDAHIDDLLPPQRFGREYLTYVLWALTPDGRPHNLGELLTDSGNDSHVKVTTDLQAFALIVTAEPYSAVRRPSDVVVAENEIRPTTEGKVEYVNAKYELLPRGGYAWNVPANLESVTINGPKVSMKEYEQRLALYQAQSAIEIARQANAQQYAAPTFDKAEQQYRTADAQYRGKRSSKDVIQSAREAAQTAEDARIIAEQASKEAALAKAKADAAEAQQARLQAEQLANADRNRINSIQAELDSERAARQRAEADAAAARDRAAKAEADARAKATEAANAAATAPQTTTVIVTPRPQDPAVGQKRSTRMALNDELERVMETRDTPRGLVVTMRDAAFNGNTLRSTGQSDAARIAAIVARYPGLQVEVEGHMDAAGSRDASLQRAESVRDAMTGRGLARNAVVARGMANTRPLTSNATASGKEQNRRVEIVISGTPIGDVPAWDQPVSRR